MSLLSFVAAARRPVWWGGRRAWVGWLRGGLRLGFGLLLLAWTGVLVAWLTLHWLILPRLDDWRPRIEAQASRALGHPVQLGQIAVHSTGWVPAFVLRDVVLRDAQGREALRLPQVSAALSVPSLLAFQLRFEQLLIEDARLEVRRDAQGRWHVAGLDVATTDTGIEGTAAIDWCFDQHEIVIRGGVLRWVDELRTAPPLQLSDVLLVLRNQGRRHALRLDATPPADWGQRFSLRAQARAPLLGPAHDWQHWKGEVFADLPRVDVAQLRHYLSLPVDLQQGQAGLRAWVDWDQGLPQALTLDASLREVSVRLAPDLDPLAFERLSGRFVAERSATGVKLAMRGLSFATRADSNPGRDWAPSQLAVSWRQTQATRLAEVGASHPVTGGEFSADRLDLAALADLAERLPIGAGLRGLLHQLNPEGTVQPVAARWDGPLDAPRTFSVQAQVRALAIAAAPSPEPGGIGRPGWHGADLVIRADETGGQAELKLSDGALELPGVFEQSSLALAHLSTQLTWRIEPARPATRATPAVPPGAAPGATAVAGATPTEPSPRIELKVHNARFDNADARGALNATWHSGTGTGFGKGGRLPGVLELSGSLSEGRANRVARYLPLGIDAHTRAWVQQAVQGGELREVSYRVKGDLWDFPYVNRQDGEFRVAGKLQDVTLSPVAGGAETVAATLAGPATAHPPFWPAFSGVSGELLFERNAMQFNAARGRLWGVELSEVQGRIRELSDKALLEIDGQARGPLSDLLRYLNTTPVGSWTGDALAQASASGNAELKLGLNIPLAHSADTVVKASVQLQGNDLRLRPDLPPLPNARGRIEASHKGLQITALRSTLAGGEVQIDGGSQPDGSLRFGLAGSASADGLRRLAEPALATRWGPRLQGQAAYRALVSLHHGQTEWQLTSNLSGMAIDLPAPLKKAADASLMLRMGSTWQTEPRGAEWLRLELGALQASVVLDASLSGPARVLRSALAYNSPLPEPLAGGHAVLALQRLDLDAWRTLLASGGKAVAPPVAVLVPALALAPAPQAPLPTGASPAAVATEAGWLPQQVQLKATELLAGGRRLTGVSLDLQRLLGPDGDGWRVQGTADQTAGSIEYREPRSADGAGRVKARLSRLSLPPAEADAVPDSVARLLEQAPLSVPALDIEIEDFELRGHKLGRLAVEAVNRATASAEPGEPGEPGARRPRSEWRLNRLQLGNPDAQLNATGRWLAGAAKRQMALDFTLDVADGGALLQRLGLGAVLKGTKGQLKGALAWDGSPLGLDFPTLGGTLGLALTGGQFLKVDAGAARLLGVLSLQALPRRLLLDFRDVFQEGFAFDNISADLRIARGVAYTDNLRLRGVQAVVLMDGSADIARETQDLQVVVLPELNTASAALAYAAINPAIAVGAFLGQWLLSEPLRQASAREFRVTGPWADPKVERIERRLLDPLPAVAAAESGSGPLSRSATQSASAAALAAAAAASAVRP